jgi:hypothetical protein
MSCFALSESDNVQFLQSAPGHLPVATTDGVQHIAAICSFCVVK